MAAETESFSTMLTEKEDAKCNKQPKERYGSVSASSNATGSSKGKENLSSNASLSWSSSSLDASSSSSPTPERNATPVHGRKKKQLIPGNKTN